MVWLISKTVPISKRNCVLFKIIPENSNIYKHISHFFILFIIKKIFDVMKLTWIL